MFKIIYIINHKRDFFYFFFCIICSPQLFEKKLNDGDVWQRQESVRPSVLSYNVCVMIDYTASLNAVRHDADIL